MFDFYCPHCSWGMNKEDTHEIHEEDVVGKWDIECKNCNKEIKLYGEAVVDYWAESKNNPPIEVAKSLKEVS